VLPTLLTRYRPKTHENTITHKTHFPQVPHRPTTLHHPPYSHRIPCIIILTSLPYHRHANPPPQHKQTPHLWSCTLSWTNVAVPEDAPSRLDPFLLLFWVVCTSFVSVSVCIRSAWDAAPCALAQCPPTLTASSCGPTIPPVAAVPQAVAASSYPNAHQVIVDPSLCGARTFAVRRDGGTLHSVQSQDSQPASTLLPGAHTATPQCYREQHGRDSESTRKFVVTSPDPDEHSVIVQKCFGIRNVRRSRLEKRFDVTIASSLHGNNNRGGVIRGIRVTGSIACNVRLFPPCFPFFLSPPVCYHILENIVQVAEVERRLRCAVRRIRWQLAKNRPRSTENDAKAVCKPKPGDFWDSHLLLHRLHPLFTRISLFGRQWSRLPCFLCRNQLLLRYPILLGAQ
jgi:hypothetical protein